MPPNVEMAGCMMRTACFMGHRAAVNGNARCAVAWEVLGSEKSRMHHVPVTKNVQECEKR